MSGPGLARPPEGLADFPSCDVSTVTLHRVTRADRSAWWFAARGPTGGGRFDLASPRGTCYLADDPVAALLEVLRPPYVTGRSIVAAQALQARVVWHVGGAPDVTIVADATARRAAGFGVTKEIGTITPYDVPRAWADALDAAGHGGVRWWLRFDPADGRGVALFGEAGPRPGWPQGERRPADDYRALVGELGVEVLDVPAADQLRFVT